MEKQLINSNDFIKNKIHYIRGKYVMLDRDLAELYEVETKVLNQAVKRNIERFPDRFMFQLDENEFLNLRYQIGTTKKDWRKKRFFPFVFTEQGVAMLSTILKSNIAIETSIKIMDAFILMRKFNYKSKNI